MLFTSGYCTLPPRVAITSMLERTLHHLAAVKVSRFVFEFNAAGKVSHLDQTYTWYGINGFQYSNSSRIMRR